MHSETELIAKAQSGNQRACRKLFDAHADAIYALAFRMCADAELAKDVVQDAFFKAFGRLDSFDERSAFGTWIHRITVNTALDALRKRQREQQRFTQQEPEQIEQASLFDQRTSSDEDRADLREEAAASMRELSDLERMALTLRHFEGHSIAETSKLMGISDGACKQAVFRAVKKMRQSLSHWVTT